MAPPYLSYTTKLKVQLKLAIARLRMIQQRDDSLSKTNRRAMAQLLEQGKIESARIRVENIIRTDIISELHELLELYCELLLARAGLLEGSGPCDPGLEEAVHSLIYAAPKTEVKELQTVRTLLAERFGKEFVLSATTNANGRVSPNVVKKLQVTPPREELVQGYLEEIAKAYGVLWPEQSPVKDAESGDEDGGSGGGGGGSAEKALSKAEQEQLALSEVSPPADIGARSPLRIAPPKMSTDNVHPKVTLDSKELTGLAIKAKKPSAAKKPGPEGKVPDISELERRPSQHNFQGANTTGLGLGARPGWPSAPRDQKYQSNFVEFRNNKIVYRRYAGLFFCACVDTNDNELAYLEAIHFFVEVLDSFFGNVCELDLVFNFYKVYAILDEVFLAGEIEETSKQMMYVSGETAEPSVETTGIIEDIVRQQVVELIRHDQAKVSRLRTFLSWKDVRKNVKDSDDKGGGDDIGGADDAVAPPVDEAAKKNKKAKVGMPWEPASFYSQEVPERDDEEDEEEEELNYLTLQRLRKADERTKAMTKDEYVTWSEYRQASFTYRKGKRFREWAGFGLVTDSKPSDDIVDILGFLTYEMVQYLTENALRIKEHEDLLKAQSGGDNPKKRKLFQGGLFDLPSEGRVPVEPRHVQEAYRRLQERPKKTRAMLGGTRLKHSMPLNIF
ncbi:AP-2 complex subunit sigma [Ceratocystis lukuohia]|uniref:AP-2 complex subunit sigma n=1 Tax=Ceratocystis lukuohia TaxID=2019550 RepID=A0ABR4MN53_9PEZI